MLIKIVAPRVIVIVALLVTGGCGNDPPNVLFIAIDDLNDWTSSLKGHPGVKTPNLTRLASMGIEFTNAHTPTPTCLAARASLMAGIRPSTSGVYANQNSPWRDNPILRDVVTLSRYFSNNGYHSLGSGKIHHHADRDSWDEYWPSFDKSRPPGARPKNRLLVDLSGRTLESLDWSPFEVGFEDMSDGKIANWAIEKLQGSFDKPFFLAAGLVSTHMPWYVPREYFETNSLEQMTLPSQAHS